MPPCPRFSVIYKRQQPVIFILGLHRLTLHSNLLAGKGNGYRFGQHIMQVNRDCFSLPGNNIRSRQLGRAGCTFGKTPKIDTITVGGA